MSAIVLKSSWNEIFEKSDLKTHLEDHLLQEYMNQCRWFAGKALQQKSFCLTNIYNLAYHEKMYFLCIVQVQYHNHEPENYFLPISSTTIEQAINPKGIICPITILNESLQLIDALYDESFQQCIFKNIIQETSFDTFKTQLKFKNGKGLQHKNANEIPPSNILLVEQSNSSIVYSNIYFLKIYRKLFAEANPEVEMVAFLTENSDFKNLPSFCGSVSLLEENKPEITLGLMQKMVENDSDAWSLLAKKLDSFVNEFEAHKFSIDEQIFDDVSLLAQRTAEMHMGLYSTSASENFVAEKLDLEYKQFIVNRIHHLLESRYQLIFDKYTSLDPAAQELAWEFMEAKEMVESFLKDFLNNHFESLRIRIHGDYHLGQILAAKNDYIIIDFEGEPESSIVERKIKHSPLKDLAGMIRSYHYAISAKFTQLENVTELEKSRIQKASSRWYNLIYSTYYNEYIATFGKPHPLFANNTEVNFLLLIYLLEKAVYELGYEISYRPSWVKIPLIGIVDVIREIEKIRN